MKKKYVGVVILMIALCFLMDSCEKKEIEGQKWTMFNFKEYTFPESDTIMYNVLKRKKKLVIQSGAEFRKLFELSADIDFSSKTLLLGTSEFSNTVDEFSQSFYKDEFGNYIYKVTVNLLPQISKERIYYGIIVNKITKEINFQVETKKK